MSESLSPHPEEPHKSQRSNWLRAAVLGVDDGVVSVASLMIGVAAAHASSSTILTAGIAGLSAGALSMAAGEYVSVSSQRDSERSDIGIETRSINKNPKEELAELAEIYEKRGLKPNLAKQVAVQLHEKDAVAAHLKDELGINHETLANPIQAAATSAVAFAAGALVPILVAIVVTGKYSTWAIVLGALITLGISGAIGAAIGGGNRIWAAGRVLLGGGIAMAITALIGHIIGRSI